MFLLKRMAKCKKFYVKCTELLNLCYCKKIVMKSIFVMCAYVCVCFLFYYRNDLVSIDVPWSRSLTELHERIRSLLFIGARIVFENSPVESIPLLLHYINHQTEKSSKAFHMNGVDTVKKNLIKKILSAFDVIQKSPVLELLEVKAKELLQSSGIFGFFLSHFQRFSQLCAVTLKAQFFRLAVLNLFYQLS